MTMLEPPLGGPGDPEVLVALGKGKSGISG